MAEGTHIPGTQACGEWETLLADALDGLLAPEEETRFLTHKAVCPACAALYDEARKGREWLQFLSPEPEPPEGLLEKILAATGPGHSLVRDADAMPAPAGSHPLPAFVPPLRQHPGFFAGMRHAVQPRLLLTAAMAFFSIALTLNLTGVQLRNLRLADLRPRAVRSYMERQLNMASVPIVRYYDHLRFVYEVEARVRDLRGQSGDEDPGVDRQQKQPQPAAPGETRKNPGQIRDRGTGGSRQQATPVIPGGSGGGAFLETSLIFPLRSLLFRRQFGAYMVQTCERRTPWIA